MDSDSEVEYDIPTPDKLDSDNDSDCDPDLQAMLLQKLDDYADEVIGDSDKKTTKAKKTPKKSSKQEKRRSNNNLFQKTEKQDKVVVSADKHSGEIGSQSVSNHGNVKIADKQEVTSSENIQVLKSKTNKKLKEKLDKSVNRGDNRVNDNLKKSDQSQTISSEDDINSEGEVGTDSDYASDNSDCDAPLLESIESKSADTSSTHRHLEELKLNLGLTEKDFTEYKKKDEIAQRGRSGVKDRVVVGGKKRAPPQIVVFDDPAKKKMKREAEMEKKTQKSRTGRLPVPTPTPGGDQLEFRKMMFDVRKFGTAGMDKDAKEDGTVSLLVALGAKPPKTAHLNVKEYRDKKLEDRSSVIKDDKYRDFVTKSESSKSKRRKRDQESHPDGQLGQYKHGIQYLRKDDLNKIKSSKPSGGNKSSKKSRNT